MPMKKRVTKRRLAKINITVTDKDYDLHPNGSGIFLNDEVAEAFGRYALIAYSDIGDLLKEHI